MVPECGCNYLMDSMLFIPLPEWRRRMEKTDGRENFCSFFARPSADAGKMRRDGCFFFILRDKEEVQEAVILHRQFVIHFEY